MHKFLCGLAVFFVLSAIWMPVAVFGQDQAQAGDAGSSNHLYLPFVQGGAEAGAVRIFRTTDWHNEQRANGTGPYAGFGNLTYHGGPIMQTVKAYTIFWVPTGKTIANGYQTLLNRYFSDIGGSSFYNVNIQYYQNPPKVNIKNISTLGGTWLDTAAYPGGRGTGANPLTDADIQNEIVRAIQQNGWVINGQNSFVVFTAKGVESCYDSVDCTPGTAYPVYCAYHSNFAWSGQNVIYSNMPYAETWPGSCRAFSKSPNGNLDADSEISIASHEHFESATDPNGNAWYDAAGYEDGDKCAYGYGTIAANGSNVTLNGHPYIIQREWNNARRNCVLKYP